MASNPDTNKWEYIVTGETERQRKIRKIREMNGEFEDENITHWEQVNSQSLADVVGLFVLMIYALSFLAAAPFIAVILVRSITG